MPFHRERFDAAREVSTLVEDVGISVSFDVVGSGTLERPVGKLHRVVDHRSHA